MITTMSSYAQQDDFTSLANSKLLITCTSAYRRLANKTQVFHNINGSNGHLYRTRLTHSNEVAALSAIVANQLGLNAQLAELLGLAHDIGHSCFGHIGQDALQYAMNKHTKGKETFEHNSQAMRILSVLEDATNDNQINSSIVEGLKKRSEHGLITPFNYGESQVMDVCDLISYLSSDIQDALNNNLIKLDDILQLNFFQNSQSCWDKETFCNDVNNTNILLFMRKTLAKNVIDNGKALIASRNIQTPDDFKTQESLTVYFDNTMGQDVDEMIKFMFANVYLSEHLIPERKEAHDLLVDLFDYFMIGENYTQMGSGAVKRIQSGFNTKARGIADYLSGCDDKFAYELRDKLLSN